MKFTLEISLNSRTMSGPYDVVRALLTLAEDIHRNGLIGAGEVGRVPDANGKPVGEWGIMPDAQHHAAPDENFYISPFPDKFFRLRAITTTVDSANDYLTKHPDTGLIAVFGQFNFIADQEARQ